MNNNLNLEDTILQAIDIIASKKIESAGYDKTIQATIVSCVDATVGKYKIKYQDSFFFAYSNNINTSYSEGTGVYILVPNGDMNKDKTILGTTKKLGINYVTVAEGDEMYAPIGMNVISNNGIYQLNSYQNNTIVLYSKQFQNDKNLISIDTQAVKEYLNGSNYIVAGGYVKTNLKVEQQYQGNYGILFGLDFIDNATQQEVTRYYTVDVDKMMGNPYRLSNQTRQYDIFEIDGGNFLRVNMISLFTKDFPIQKEDMPNDIFISNIQLGGAVSLSQQDLNSCALVLLTPKGYIFNKNSAQDQIRTIQAQVRVKGKTVDLNTQPLSFYWFVENVGVTSRSEGYNKYGGQGWYCLNDFTVVQPEELDDNGNVITPAVINYLPKKNIFNIKKSDILTQKIKYKCAVVYQGSVLTKEISILNFDSDYDIYIGSDSGTEFYYDIGNPTLTCYCKKEDKDVDINSVKFIWSSINSFGNYQSLPETIQKNNDYQKLIILYNNIQEYLNIEWILSQMIFDLTLLLPTISIITNKVKEENKRIKVQQVCNNLKNIGFVNESSIQKFLNKYNIFFDQNTSYKIFLQNLNQTISLYKRNNQRVKNNQVIDINIKDITRFTTFKCSVFSTNGNQYIGTAALTLTNTLEGEDLYSLIINNGSQVFKYNTHGVSPASKQNKIPYEIPALSFTVYDNLGNPIDDDVIKHSDITWTVPTQNTLLTISNDYQGVPDSSLTKMTYKNLMSFSYGIAQNFNVNKTQNNIQLKINYNGLNLVAKTDLTFTKEGNSGTNGTDYYCKVVPNVIYGKVPLYPTIYYNGESYSFNWNNDTGTNKWFKAQLWHNGGSEPIYKNHTTGESTQGKIVTILKWEVLKNNYALNVEDNSNLIVDSNGTWSLNTSESPYRNDFLLDTYLKWHPADIVKVTLSYDGYTYYGILPVIIVRYFNNNNNNYRINLKENTGFREVLYSSSGVNPVYDNHAPFEISVEQNISGTWNDISKKESNEYGLKYKWYYCGAVKKRIKNEQDKYEWQMDAETTYDNGQSSKKWLMQYNLLNTLQKNQKAIKPVDKYNGQCVTAGLACQIRRISDNILIGWVHIPIHMLLNRFNNSAINGWDGNSVNLGDQNGGMILAPQVGAGVKNSNNEFTGVFIGTAKDPQQDNSDQLNNTGNSVEGKFAAADEEIGLFGYHDGSRSIFLDAKTGKAVFGETGQAQIILDPSDASGQDKRKKAIIKSGNYNYNPSQTTESEKGTASRTPVGTGMMIDLTTPEIKFGSGNFQVNKEGKIKARGGGQIAGWKITDNAMYNSKTTSGVNQNSTGINSNPNIDKTSTSNNGTGNGSEYRSVKMPPISSDDEGGWRNLDKAAAFWAGGSKFYVTHDGYLRTEQASIGSGTKPIFIGKGGNDNSAIFSGRKSSKNASQSGFYIGVDGIGIGNTTTMNALTQDAPMDNTLYIDDNIANNIKDEFLTRKSISNFQVDANGMFYAKRGYIGNGRSGWQIGNNFLRNNKLNLVDVSKGTGVYIGTNGISLGRSTSADSDGNYIPAFKVDSSGNLTANKGQIANWTISQNSIRTKNATDAYYNNSGRVRTVGMYFGEGGLRLGANFHVDSGGNLYANNGDFEGKITSSEGQIGAWILNGSGFINKTGTVSIYPTELKLGSFTAKASGALSGSNWYINADGTASFTNQFSASNLQMSGGYLGGGSYTTLDPGITFGTTGCTVKSYIDALKEAGEKAAKGMYDGLSKGIGEARDYADQAKKTANNAIDHANNAYAKAAGAEAGVNALKGVVAGLGGWAEDVLDLSYGYYVQHSGWYYTWKGITVQYNQGQSQTINVLARRTWAW